MTALYNRVFVVSATTGTGNITPGSAVAGYRSFSALTNNDVVSYTIVDGVAWETGRGTWNGSVLTRNVLESSNSNAAINLSGNSELLFVDGLAQDFGWSNNRLAKTANYTVINSDNRNTIALGGTAFYTLTFNAASGYDASFVILVVNEDTSRGKTIAPNGITNFILWPGQSCFVYNDNNVWKISPAAQRWYLTGSVTLFVDGSLGASTNDGLASGAGAFATIQQAYNVITSSLDLSGQTVQITCANQTYTGGILLSQPWTGGGTIILDGGSGTISTTSTSCVRITCVLPGTVTLQNVKLQTTTTGHLIEHVGGGTVVIGAGLNFGAPAAPYSHMTTTSAGAIIQVSNNYTISGSAGAHININGPCWFICAGITVTISANVTFSSAFVIASSIALLQNQGCTFSLGAFAVTGARYIANANGVINTNGGGANYFPGNSAGAVASGGEYL